PGVTDERQIRVNVSEMDGDHGESHRDDQLSGYLGRLVQAERALTHDLDEVVDAAERGEADRDAQDRKPRRSERPELEAGEHVADDDAAHDDGAAHRRRAHLLEVTLRTVLANALTPSPRAEEADRDGRAEERRGEPGRRGNEDGGHG